MSPLRAWLDKQERHFKPGGRLARLHPLFEAIDTALYTPAAVTATSSHVRDAIDLKRMMSLVVAAALP